MARICLSEPAPECFDGDTVVAEDCKKAAQLLSYNTDGKFKPELKEEKTIGACTLSVDRMESSRVVTKDLVNAAVDAVISDCPTHSGRIIKPSNSADTGGFKVQLLPIVTQSAASSSGA
ncbi:hypothetical protein PCASD_13556 [Puccinia coronata f. sp. avenae]|uniref:Uncharacterized protein n=1 Tax=Puccinia coronata f. sp. avenae TaxID=200324 RepID=A0A2N5TDW1_9BASI|nr:hypothetical protein PCASD_13556 [Puccinia coronata f. sp. avenae]